MGSRLDRPKPEYKLNKQIAEPKDATLEQIFNPTISPFASIGARSLLLAWASSGGRYFLLHGVKQTRDKSQYRLSKPDVPLDHVIEVLNIIRYILFTPSNDR